MFTNASNRYLNVWCGSSCTNDENIPYTDWVTTTTLLRVWITQGRTTNNENIRQYSEH
jgi:hypothetical protein